MKVTREMFEQAWAEAQILEGFVAEMANAETDEAKLQFIARFRKLDQECEQLNEKPPTWGVLREFAVGDGVGILLGTAASLIRNPDTCTEDDVIYGSCHVVDFLHRVTRGASYEALRKIASAHTADLLTVLVFVASSIGSASRGGPPERKLVVAMMTASYMAEWLAYFLVEGDLEAVKTILFREDMAIPWLFPFAMEFASRVDITTWIGTGHEFMTRLQSDLVPSILLLRTRWWKELSAEEQRGLDELRVTPWLVRIANQCVRTCRPYAGMTEEACSVSLELVKDVWKTLTCTLNALEYLAYPESRHSTERQTNGLRGATLLVAAEARDIAERTPWIPDPSAFDIPDLGMFQPDYSWDSPHIADLCSVLFADGITRYRKLRPDRDVLAPRICMACRAVETKDGPKFFRCTACRISTYCSRNCQRKHWKKSHRRRCGPQSSKSAADSSELTHGREPAACTDGPGLWDID